MTDHEKIEKYLIDRIQEIYRRAEGEAQPYFDRLVEMRSLRPPMPLIVCKHCYKPIMASMVCPCGVT